MFKFIHDPGLFFMICIATTFAGYLLSRKISGSLNAFLSSAVKIAIYILIILSSITAASTIGDVATNLTTVIRMLIFIGGSAIGLWLAAYVTNGWQK